jgi:Family of unknown function (DUF5995)
MSTTPTSMTELAIRLRSLDPGRPVEAVIERLREIERERGGYGSPNRRRRPDGVACFNYMYLHVTERIQASAHRFEAWPFVERLAVVFAEIYLQAYDAAGARAWVSRAWAPLFERQADKDPTPMQFAIAGMNAHINNDLPWALMQAWNEYGVTPGPASPELRDFHLVDAMLEDAQAEVRGTLESRLQRILNALLRRVDDVIAAFAIARARGEAWNRGERWGRRFDGARWRAPFDEAAANAHERQVGYQSHLILAA